MFRLATELKTGPEEEKKLEVSTVKTHCIQRGEGRMEHSTQEPDCDGTKKIRGV